MSTFQDPRLTELISRDAIAERVAQLGEQIRTDYQECTEPLVFLGVLKGSIIFLADLCRAVDLPLEIDTMAVSSYGEATKSSGVVRITQDLTKTIADKHVVIVEDIFDTGLTLKYLLEYLEAKKAKSVKICSLLKKNTSKQVPIHLDYVGFEIPDKFVVGYGLDVAERFRNLPMIAVFNG